MRRTIQPAARASPEQLSILRAARECPERTALVARGREISFAELAERVAAAMARLGERGIGRDLAAPAVALRGESSVAAVVTFYALMEMGIPAVMVHPRAPARERRRWLAEIGVEVFLDGADCACGSSSSTARSAGSSPPDAESPLAIVRTSGSSGHPRGVVLSRRAFAAAAAASADNLGWRDDDRWLLSLPIAHVGGLSILTRCLLARRAVVVRPAQRFDAAALARIARQDRVTLLSLVPTMLARLLDLEAFELPSRVRAILLGGAGAPTALLGRAADRGWPVLTSYGLTEACSQVATQRYGTVNRGGRGCEPVAGMEIRLRSGVVEIRGASLMSGYLPATEASPFDADGWLATGDLGRLDAAGRLHILGRRDEVIVTGGENVHPREVEEALREHPAIRSACVFAVADDEWGQTVAAALVAEARPADADLASHLQQRLASYQRPRRIAYFDTLPETTLGKIDRRETARIGEPRLRRLASRESARGE